MINKCLLLLLLLSFCLLSKDLNTNLPLANITYAGQKYITDENGSIMMYVNVLGHINKPGVHLVYDGIDISTLISAVGGFKEGANLRRIKIFRSSDSTDDIKTYNVDLKNYFKNGNRDSFVRIMPNDTIIIEQTHLSKAFSNVGTLSTLLNVINLYFLIEYNQDKD